MKIRHVFFGVCVGLMSISSLMASGLVVHSDSDSDDPPVVTNAISMSAPTTSFSNQATHLSLGDVSPQSPMRVLRNNGPSDQVVIPIDDQSPLVQGGPVLPLAVVGAQPLVPVDPAVAHRRQEEERWASGETFYYYLGAVNNNLGVFCTGAFTCLTTVAAGVDDSATKQILLYTLSGLGAAATMFLYFGSKAATAEKDRHDKLEAAYARDRAQGAV